MLSQGKRKRTVEDFNQFCTFVLAYAGYIPHPNEEWKCNDSVPRDSNTYGPQQNEDWGAFSPPHSCYAPSQSKRGAGAKLEEKLGKRLNKEKPKRRKDGKRSVLEGERKPHKRGRDAVGGKRSSSAKGSSKNTTPQKAEFEQKDGASLCSSSGVAGASSVLDSQQGFEATAHVRPLPEESADTCSGTYRLPTLKQEPQEHSGCMDWANGDQNGTGHQKNTLMGYLTSAHVSPSCDDIQVQPNNHRREQEVKTEPVDLTAVSRPEQAQEAGLTPQEEEEPRGLKQGLAKDRCSAEGTEEEEEGGGESEGSLAGKGTWEESQGGATDILRLVMERRLTGQVPDDQETGYHTDWASSTPEQAGSDTDQDTPANDSNTTVGSEYGTEDSSVENGKLTEEEDSWDLITCFCMKPFAGRPMIECGECRTWVHLSCAKIRRAHVPDVFVCQPCRDAKHNIRRSSRARTASRKCFGD